MLRQHQLKLRKRGHQFRFVRWLDGKPHPPIPPQQRFSVFRSIRMSRAFNPLEAPLSGIGQDEVQERRPQPVIAIAAQTSKNVSVKPESPSRVTFKVDIIVNEEVYDAERTQGLHPASSVADGDSTIV